MAGSLSALRPPSTEALLDVTMNAYRRGIRRAGVTMAVAVGARRSAGSAE
jgi:hypothetical protein